MILRILKSNRSVNYLLFPLFGILFWLNDLIFPEPTIQHSNKIESPFFGLVIKLTNNNAILNGLIAVLVVLLLSILLQLINNRYNFIRIRTMLPAPLFIIILGGLTSLHTLHPVYFAAIFLLLAIYRSFGAFEHSKPYSEAFDTGFLLGLGSMFYFNYIVIFPAFFFGISFLSRDYGWRQFILTIIGFILPVIFAVSYFFLTDQLDTFLSRFISSYNQKDNQIKFNVTQIIFLGYLAVLTVLGSIKIIQQFDSKKVSTRKYFLVFFFIFILSLSSYILFPSIMHEMIIIVAIPLTLLISNFFVFLKSRFWGELIFSILLLIVIILEFTR